MATNNLKTNSEAIFKGQTITGKSGLDIFVRWKHQQPMGWHPDLKMASAPLCKPRMQAKKAPAHQTQYPMGQRPWH